MDGPRADVVRRTFANPDSASASAGRPLSGPDVPLLVGDGEGQRSHRPDIQRHADPAGGGDRERTPGIGRAAGLGAGDRHRWRRHNGRDGRRRADGVEGRIAAGLHRRRRQGDAVARYPGRSCLDAADGAEGHIAPGRRDPHADRLRRPDRDARRRRRRQDRRIAAGPAAGRRRSDCRARPLHGGRGRSARLPVAGGAAARRGRDREQSARRPDRRTRSARAHPLLRRGAAFGDEVPAPRRPGRSQSPAGHAAAHRRQQVLPPRRRGEAASSSPPASRAPAKSCSRIVAWCWAASRRPRSPPISCA